MQAHGDWVLRIFETQVARKNDRFGPCIQTIFPFLMTMILLVNDLIDSCEHYKKLDCLQDQLMSLSEKIKGIHNQILEFVQYPDQYQTCQEYSMKILK